MLLDSQKKPTKAIAWLALDKATQDELVKMEVEHFDTKNLNFEIAMSYRKEQTSRIHRALGVQVGNNLEELSSSLETIARHCSGGISDDIKNYLQKIKDIEAAVKTEATNRRSSNIDPAGLTP